MRAGGCAEPHAEPRAPSRGPASPGAAGARRRAGRKRGRAGAGGWASPAAVGRARPPNPAGPALRLGWRPAGSVLTGRRAEDGSGLVGHLALPSQCRQPCGGDDDGAGAGEPSGGGRSRRSLGSCGRRGLPRPGAAGRRGPGSAASSPPGPRLPGARPAVLGAGRPRCPRLGSGTLAWRGDPSPTPLAALQARGGGPPFPGETVEPRVCGRENAGVSLAAGGRWRGSASAFAAPDLAAALGCAGTNQGSCLQAFSLNPDSFCLRWDLPRSPAR